MKKTVRITTRALAFVLTFVMALALFSVFPTTKVSAADTVINYPIYIDGTPLQGLKNPAGIGGLVAGTGYRFYEGDDVLLLSNRWYDYDTMNLATVFEVGKRYFYQICIQANEGYCLPYDVEDLICVTGIQWSRVYYNYLDNFRTYYAEFHFTYTSAGVPAAQPQEIALPLVFDGAPLAGTHVPKALDTVRSTRQILLCDGYCCGGLYLSNTWFNADNTLATNFVDGERYYYQISFHAAPDYVFPEDFDVDTSIQVTGIDWSYVRGSYNVGLQRYFVEFHITYDETRGVPSTKKVEFPIIIDGSSLVGATAPISINTSLLPTGNGYSFCYNECGEGEFYISNRWYDKETNQPITEFVDGGEYYYGVCIHLDEGYSMPANMDLDHAIVVTNVGWEGSYSRYLKTRNLFYAEFYITYDEDIGVPAAKPMDLPLIIDGSSMAGSKAPVTIEELPNSETYYHGFERGYSTYFVSNIWYNYYNSPADTFVDGERYYYQIAVFPEAGYVYPDGQNSYEGIQVTGIEWDDIYGYYNHYHNVYYVEFYITYDSETGIPAFNAGDVNGDGTTDSADASLVLQYDLGLIETIDVGNINNGDVNRDGTVDSADASLILQFDLGLIESF